MGRRKSQSSVELMVILAVGLIAVLAFFSLSQDKLSQTQATLSLSQARSAVETLAQAADEVYSEGSNSTKQVYVTIPDGVNFSKSSISSHSLDLYLRGTDVNSQTAETVFGSWPNVSGSYWLTVTSYQGSVGIGTSVMQVSPTSLYIEIGQGAIAEYNLTVSNMGAASLTITGVLSWAPTIVNVTNESSLSLNLPSGSSVNSTFLINTDLSAIGSYGGQVAFSASDGETQVIPITVHVSGSGGTGGETNVSYLSIATYKNSSCAYPKLIFDSPDNTTLFGLGWPAGVTLNFNIYNSGGSSVYSASPVTNATGGFSVVWSPAGLPGGQYSENVSDPASGNSAEGAFFMVGSC